MKKIFIVICLLFIVAELSAGNLHRDTIIGVIGDTLQETHTPLDTTVLDTTVNVQMDTVIVLENVPNDTLPPSSFNSKDLAHSPHKATIYALTLPGAGQIYNKQYWKLPILYGGVGATIYGLNFNGKYYKRYRRAFIDYTHYLNALSQDENTPYPEDPSWDKLNVRGNVQEFTASQRTRFQKLLENKKISYKRDRDLLYIVMAGIYIIQIIDANVFAFFYNYEIDDNLSFNFRPSASYHPMSGGTFGFSLTFNFK